jgi:hypothetical protein
VALLVIGSAIAAYVAMSSRAPAPGIGDLAAAEPARVQGPPPPAFIERAKSPAPKQESPAPKQEAVVENPTPVEPPAEAPAPRPEPEARPAAPKPPQPAPAALTEAEIKVNRAVDRGVVHLKKYLDGNNRGGRLGGHAIGEGALIGLTLLECGVAPEDKYVQDLATLIRDEKERLTHTYSLALSIFFLDRLGDPADRGLIETYALRLAAGQTAIGAWTYNCPLLTDAEHQKFAEYLNTNASMNGSSGMRAQGAEKLPARLKNCGVVLWQRGVKPGGPGFAGGDNSNTQFALLGLWVARRNGAPVQPSLAFVERYFRQSVGADGGWGYTSGFKIMPSTASMTCAGLLGLAVGHGVQVKMGDEKGDRPPVADAGMARGFRALEAHLKAHMNGGPAPGKRAAIQGFGIGGRDYYLFWSIERVAMIYDLKKLAGREWYPWLSKLLVDAQKADGSWGGAEHDNCFALLVLRRANVAKDLTRSLGASLNIKDLQMLPETNGKDKEKDKANE